MLCNEKKKEHLFRMEIQGLCWNKQALPQCGWFACRGIIWSNYFPCRHIQLVCPLNVNIFIMSNIKVTAQCQISLCHTVILYRALHISCNMKLLCFLEEKKKISSKDLQIADDRWLHKMCNYCSLT